jgi:hypothetical protein
MGRKHAAWILFAIALAIVCANVLAYAARQANPLITSDDWVYLDGFVRKAAASDLSLSDFFVKRAEMDHAQPLRRLVLLMHYEWFGLDYAVGGLVGVLFAFANLGLLWRMAAPGDEESRRSWWFLAGFLAIASIHLSLNSGTIYTWPLLTLAFSNQFFVLLCILQAWKANADPTRRSAFALFGIAFAMNVVTDDTGLLAGIAIVLATLAWQARGGRGALQLRDAAKRVALPIAGAYVSYKLAYFAIVRGAVMVAPLGDRAGFGEKLQMLAHDLPELLASLHVPLVAALLKKSQFARMFGAQAHVAEWALAALVLGAHAWFWWRAFARRTGRAGFAASVLMLLFYGGVAGILVGRASVYGASYFWQPRYVFLYQVSIVALLLMAVDAMASAAPAPTPGSGVRRVPAVRVVAMAFACVLLLLQCQLSAWTWGSARYSAGYQKRLARQIGELAAHPERVPDKCARALLVCRYPPAQRAELVGFLADNRLNVFSPSFQARYRLYPGK